MTPRQLADSNQRLGGLSLYSGSEPSTTASCPRMLESSLALLWKPQMSQLRPVTVTYRLWVCSMQRNNIAANSEYSSAYRLESGFWKVGEDNGCTVERILRVINSLKTKINLNYIPRFSSYRTVNTCLWLIKTVLWMLYRGVIAVCSENHTNNTSV